MFPIPFQFNEFISTHMGLFFPENRLHDLERGIISAAREFGFNDIESCIKWLMSVPLTKRQIEILASHLTVGETYFFRGKKSFEMLEKEILPEIIHSRLNREKTLRIWSAGCSTGEEPYSIAIIVGKLVPDPRDWNITILATDFNPYSLQKASKGVYSEWSFRDNPAEHKERYFKKTKEGQYAIFSHIKKLVTFSYLNLAEDAYPSLLNNTNAMDIIFCRNVLMYFSQDTQRRVIQNLYRCLVDGGYLIVSPCETSHILFSGFKAINFQGSTFYRKPSEGICDQRSWASDLWLEIQDHEKEIPDQQLEIKLQETKIQKKAEPIPEIELTITDIRQSTADPHIDALTLYEKGFYSEAAEKIAMLLLQERDEPKALLLMAKVYANQGKLSDALELCEKAIDADKLNPGSYYLLAVILQEQGQFKEAAASLKKALYLNQKFVLAHFALGNLANKQGKGTESKKHFENALLILKGYRQEDILPESEGMTAGRMTEIISTLKMQDAKKFHDPSYKMQVKT